MGHSLCYFQTHPCVSLILLCRDPPNQPSRLIWDPLQNSRDLWYQGNLDAEVYFLHNEGSQKTQSTQTLQQPGNKGKFFIPSVTGQHAGQYRCYCYGSAGWSQPSDTLELVVTGEGTVRFSTPGSALRTIPSHRVSQENTGMV